jgi:hypothetical protein
MFHSASSTSATRVVRVHLAKPVLGELTFVACSLDVLLAQAIGFVNSCLDFGLNRERHLQVQKE